VAGNVTPPRFIETAVIREINPEPPKEKMPATAQQKIARMLSQGQLDDSAASRMLASVRAPDPAQRPVLLNLRQSARYCGLSEQCFRRFFKEGLFPAVELGSSRWFRVSDLETTIAKRVVRYEPPQQQAA
jgi:predicted DNA-binding transcriptional regulator AlpA